MRAWLELGVGVGWEAWRGAQEGTAGLHADRAPVNPPTPSISPLPSSSYYLDRQAARADYVAALLTAVDWAAVERNLAAAEAGDVTGVLYGTSGKGAAAPAPAPAVEGAPAGAPAPAGP